VEKNYLHVRANNETNITPLVMDLTNPSPGLGWNHSERDSLASRGRADLIMALALIHHLSISNNVPFLRVAEFFATLGNHLIIEFVPKSDSQVRRLLTTRTDIFDTYDQEHFEAEFKAHFDIVRSSPVEGSERTLYLMRRRDS